MVSIHALLAESDLAKQVQDLESQQFLSTLSLRRATPHGSHGRGHSGPVSIHALLAESDAIGPLIFSVQPRFYPRSPCGERLRVLEITRNSSSGFYPRSPCGERLCVYRLPLIALPVSIHALLAESDLAGPSGPAFLYSFYPRSPCGERLIASLT